MDKETTADWKYDEYGCGWPEGKALSGYVSKYAKENDEIIRGIDPAYEDIRTIHLMMDRSRAQGEQAKR